jgi:hypothetical protein
LIKNEWIVNTRPDGTFGIISDDKKQVLPAGWPFFEQVKVVKVTADDILADAKLRCAAADILNRNTYWYHIQDAILTKTDISLTSQRYYCQFHYTATTGSYLSITYWDLTKRSATINTFVRLGDAVQEKSKEVRVVLKPTFIALEDCEK